MTTTHPTTPNHTLITTESEAERDAFLQRVQDWKDTQFYEKYNRLSSHTWLTLEEGIGLGQSTVFFYEEDAYDAFYERERQGIGVELWIHLFTETGRKYHLALSERECLLASPPPEEREKP